MKKLLVSVATMLLLIATSQVSAQDDAMMKAWHTYITPGEPHQMLAKSDGKWKGEVTMWMAPGAAPEKTSIESENKMILGGRFQQSTHKGTMMGMPFEGISVIGYNNAKKTYSSSWVDNMSTGITYMEGTWDNATKSMNLKGRVTDPMTGKDMEVREVFRIIDDNTQLLEMYDTHDGKEMKSMEIKFTRQR